MKVTSSVQDKASEEDRAHNPHTILAHYRELAPKDINKAFERINKELTPEEKDELFCLMLFFVTNEVRKMGDFLQNLSDGIAIAYEDTDSNPPTQSN